MVPRSAQIDAYMIVVMLALMFALMFSQMFSLMLSLMFAFGFDLMFVHQFTFMFALMLYDLMFTIMLALVFAVRFSLILPSCLHARSKLKCLQIAYRKVLDEPRFIVGLGLKRVRWTARRGVISTFSWGAKKIFLFQCHRIIEKMKKHFICSNLTLFIAPFFISFFFSSSFSLFFLFFLFSFSLGGPTQSPQMTPLTARYLRQFLLGWYRCELVSSEKKILV